MRIKLTQFSLAEAGTELGNIVVSSEDTRIAARLSELEREIFDPVDLEHRISAVHNLRLNLLTGQQCVRDFFLCIHENFQSWPDVWSIFNFEITHSTKCCSCKRLNTSETNQIYVEIPVPPENSNLSDYVEEFFNMSELVGLHCDACKNFGQAEKRSELTRANEAEFLIIILARAVTTLDGYKLVEHKILATDDLLIR